MLWKTIQPTRVLDAVKIALQLLSKSIKPAFVYEICEGWAWKGSKCVCIKKQVEHSSFVSC